MQPGYVPSEWRCLQTSEDFPRERRMELATLNPEVTIAISQWNCKGWPNKSWLSPEADDEEILFHSLRPWLERSLVQLRKRSGLSADLEYRDQRDII